MTSKSRPIVPVNLMAFWLMVASAWQVLAVDPTVSNVQAKQRAGSRLVDITYDVVDPDSPTLTVYLKVSADGGATWKGPVELVSGDVGRGIVPGAGKSLVWNAGKEMPNQFGVKYRYRIGASDQWLAPAGMALIPEGPFQMGNNMDRWVNPVHTVTVSRFAIDKLEVSIELWESVRIWGNNHGYDLKVGGSSGAKHPVHSVSWFEVLKWNNARSEMMGIVPAYYEDFEMNLVYRNGENEPKGVIWNIGYRLPTEAEWEKAARGGVEGKLYPWGDNNISPELANYRESKKGGTTKIGSYGSNGYDLYDMAGNVWEWCWDLQGNYSQAETDPRGPSSGSVPPYRVVRGGCYAYESEISQVSYHNNSQLPVNGSGFCGFRSVLPPGQP